MKTVGKNTPDLTTDVRELVGGKNLQKKKNQNQNNISLKNISAKIEKAYKLSKIKVAYIHLNKMNHSAR